jgi:hypothetical protein
MFPVTMVLVRPTRGSVPRAAWAAAEVTFLSATAHTIAGGQLPTPDLLAALGIPVFALGILFLQHRLSLRTAVVAALAAQYGLHLAMAELAVPAAHAHHAAGLTPAMALAHGIGAVALVGIWLVRRRAWEVVATWPAIWCTPARATHAVPIPSVHSSTRVWLSPATRRGPPLAACA